MARREVVDDSRGDVSFYRSPEMMAGKIQQNWGSFVGIRGWRSPQAGEVACGFGMTTGKHCAEVKQVNVCGANGNCGLAILAKHVTDYGDGEGPWHWGEVAFGIHHGGWTSGGGAIVHSLPSIMP